MLFWIAPSVFVTAAIAGEAAELEIGGVMCCCCCCDEEGGGAEDAGEGSIGLGDWRDFGDKDDEGIASAIRNSGVCF